MVRSHVLIHPIRPQLTLPSLQQLDQHAPRGPAVAGTAAAFLLGAAHYALAQMSRRDTRMVLAIAWAIPVFRTAVAATILFRAPTLSALTTIDKHKWAVAACEVVRTFSQVAASRRNPVWVWASTDLLIPLLLLALPAVNPTGDAPHTTRLYAAVASASLATAWTWRDDLLSAEGIFLAVMSAGAETVRQWMVRQEADETDGGSAEAVEAVRDSSLRAAVLHVVTFVALFPLDLHRYRAYSQGPAIAYSIIWPFLALFASLALTVVQQARKLDFLSSTAIYSASNAIIVALAAAADWQNSNSSMHLFGLLLVFVANTAFQLVPPPSPSITLDLEPGAGAGYDALEPLADSSSSKIPSPLIGARPPRALALIPALMSLLGASFIALTPRPSLDIVIAHHSRPPSAVAHHLAALRLVPHVRKSRARIYIYEKGGWSDDELLRGLSGAIDPRRDEIVRLPNVGREGGSYLEHIVAHYNASTSAATQPSGSGGASWATRGGLGGGERSVRPFADLTLFLQEHLAWPGVAGPRLRRTLSPRTGFLSLGPYMTNLCGRDSEVGTEMGGINEVFELVKGRSCTEGNEEDRMLSTWFGQFAASRRTLLKNELGVYERLVRMVEAPNDDPIHQQYNPSGPSTSSNPAFGHALERSWPMLLHCDDKRIAERCREGGWDPRDCQCDD
ncbi:hypothetical protein JCM9279_001761 [Rhodotorula babjevae]